ncbi:hypothetical protein PoB_006079700 [Plakobranchus ocellatus]|uniref:Bestrophin homolog n=1 Tax=Plakobranchus ocellatus TaxID=259542 RepID=A0AAV4CQY2_9GAST|nr:hypothetical protein PoB_006079700 [Plakobranchus ocellatus]
MFVYRTLTPMVHRIVLEKRACFVNTMNLRKKNHVILYLWWYLSNKILEIISEGHPFPLIIGLTWIALFVDLWKDVEPSGHRVDDNEAFSDMCVDFPIPKSLLDSITNKFGMCVCGVRF